MKFLQFLFEKKVTRRFAVIIIRILHKESPFKADNRHTHHRLLDLGLQHRQAVLILVFFNILIVVFAYLVQNTGALKSIIFTFGFCAFLRTLLEIIHYFKVKKRRNCRKNRQRRFYHLSSSMKIEGMNAAKIPSAMDR